MEKLIELLNEFEKEKKSGFTWRSIDSYDNCVYGVDCDGETEITMYSDLYSKQYGFIKWLVDNDKIDRERINDRWGDMSVHFTDEELFIMSLSISYTPIEDLVSYFKK